jgi:predicted DNA-binding helix-hairpin-helix protein
MDALEKLTLASAETGLEAAEEAGRGGPFRTRARAGCGMTPGQLRRRFGGEGIPKEVESQGRSIPIQTAVAPGGRRVLLLKAMQTTACERNCLYCPFRAGRDSRRVTFKPDELASVFDTVHRVGKVDGLFLTTGVLKGGPCTQDRLLATAEILRRRLGYRGYLHLKLMPGAEKDQVLQAMRLADRVSVNLEAPNADRLQRLAPRKTFVDELLQPLRWVEEIRKSRPAWEGWGGRWPSSTTQFVVGPAGESDLEILATTDWLHRVLGLSRSYFMAFSPVPGTPLENHPPESPDREHRLYQASFLLRDYGFDLEDLPFRKDGRLPLEVDPKLAYARANLEGRPVEINRAEREELLRVPGVGPKAASAILEARRKQGRLRDLAQLRRLGVLAERAAPYVLLDGRQPEQQLKLL